MPVMPDTRIFGELGQDDKPGQTPLQTLGSMMQIKEQQQVMQQRELQNANLIRDAQDDAAARTSVKLAPPDHPELAVDGLLKNGQYGVAAKVAHDIYGMRTDRLTAENAQLKTNMERLGSMAQIAGSATDDASWQTVRPSIVKIGTAQYGPSFEDMVPTTYDDGAKVQQLITMGTSLNEQLQNKQNFVQNQMKLYEGGMQSLEQAKANMDPAIARRMKEDPTFHPDLGGAPMWAPTHTAAVQGQRANVAQRQLTARNADEWNQYLQDAGQYGTLPQVIQEFGQWEDGKDAQGNVIPGGVSKARARDLALTVEQRAGMEVRNRGEDRQETANAFNQLEKRVSDARADATAARAGEANARAAQANARADRRDAEREADRQRGPQMTPYQRVEATEKLDKDDKATTDWLTNAYASDPASQLKDEQGHPVKLTKSDRKAGVTDTVPFSYDRLKDGKTGEPTPLGQAYVTKKLQVQDKRRSMDNLPPLLTAAKVAVANRDQQGYEKLVQEYSDVSNGVGNLRSVVLWPDKQTLAAINEQLKDQTLAPDKRQALLKQLKDLSGR